MFISGAFSSSPISEPPKTNQMADVEVPNEGFIVYLVNFQSSKVKKKEEFGVMNLVRLQEIAKKYR